jgi:hypothetical protein
LDETSERLPPVSRRRAHRRSISRGTVVSSGEWPDIGVEVLVVVGAGLVDAATAELFAIMVLLILGLLSSDTYNFIFSTILLISESIL